MGGQEEGIVIRPPMEPVTSGKVFRPDRRFMYKYYLMMVLIAVGLYVLIIGSWLGIGYLVATVDETITYADFEAVINDWFGLVNLWFWVIMAVWMVPATILIPLYYKSIEYSVISKSGEAMPEIYVKKGIINVTRKHVPFRTITNISSRAGPFDRLLGIGNVEIETAGYSGTSQWGPEEKLEGVVFYEELRDFILQELRKFRAPYATTTELVAPERPVPSLEGTLQDEILTVLREIRDLLREMAGR